MFRPVPTEVSLFKRQARWEKFCLPLYETTPTVTAHNLRPRSLLLYTYSDGRDFPKARRYAGVELFATALTVTASFGKEQNLPWRHTPCVMDMTNQPPLKRAFSNLSVLGTISLVTFYGNSVLRIVHTSLRWGSEDS
jgi:hypothetical protein